MGPSYERWHHERSEKRPLRFVEAVITWLNKMPHLSSRSSMWNDTYKNFHSEIFLIRECKMDVDIRIFNFTKNIFHKMNSILKGMTDWVGFPALL